MTVAVGVHGVGAYLPPDVRTNDWWPAETVAKWREKAMRRQDRVRDEFAREASLGAKLSQEAIAKLANDPFQGGVERRVMPAGMSASDMETSAAREAIANAGISKDDIGLVLSFVICPDFINVPSACVVHENLGLSRRCQALNVDAVCNSFLMQVSLASAMIASGQIRYALLTQASAITRFPRRERSSTLVRCSGTARARPVAGSGFNDTTDHGSSARRGGPGPGRGRCRSAARRPVSP